jgi:DNA polymerase-3 subunit delta
MTRLYSEQLNAQLQEGLRHYYLLCGNEPLLLQESQDAICAVAQRQGFSERALYTLDNQTNWPDIFNFCQELSLFSSHKILILQASDAGINAAIGEQLGQIAADLPDEILLILRVSRITKAQENSRWFKSLSRGTYVSCLTPDQNQLPRWIEMRAKRMKLQPDEQAIQLLCYSYEGNLLALAQTLERLSLLYPDGKLTLPRIELAVNDSAHFTPYHWLDAILAGKAKRALHILRQLRQEDIEALILVRSLQKELLALLQLQRQMSHTPLKTLFDQQKVWQNRRAILTQALQRLNAEQLQLAISLLTQIEINLKQDFGYSIWAELESLSLLICGKPLLENFTHV